MSDQRPTRPTSSLVDVNWDDPKLRELLERTESLRLDNRGAFKQRLVKMHQSWHDTAPAIQVTLAAEHGQGRLTLITNFPLNRGEPVILDKDLGLGGQSGRLLCEVVNCRPGVRAEDQGRDIFIVQLETRTPYGGR